MARGNDSISKVAARVIMVLLGLALAVGVVLAAWLGFAAIPESAWSTARTPAIDDPASPMARSIDELYQIVFFLAVAVFILVEGLILWALVRYRRKPGDPEPRQVHGDNRAELAWTIAPTILVLILAYLGYGVMRERFVVEEGNALVINVTGYQWWWAFEYPDHGFTTSTEMVVPVGRPVKAQLQSADVIHSFWVPQLAGKYDAVPGTRDGGAGQNSVWFVAERAGRFEGQCAELCGTQHAGMRFTVIAIDEDEYEQWATANAAVPSVPAENEEDPLWRGYDLVTGRGACLTCHSMDGVNVRIPEGKEAAWPPPSEETRGPNLTRMASRTRLAGAVIEHTKGNAATWIERPDALKVGTKMQAMGLNAEQIDDVLSYLYSLKLDDEVMAPVFEAEPRPDGLPPAHATMDDKPMAEGDATLGEDG